MDFSSAPAGVSPGANLSAVGPVHVHSTLESDPDAFATAANVNTGTGVGIAAAANFSNQINEATVGGTVTARDESIVDLDADVLAASTLGAVGGPTDPQPGNIPGGKRDVLNGADFNNGTLSAFAVDSGVWEVQLGALSVSAASLGQDAAAVFYHDEYLPVCYELAASASGGFRLCRNRLGFQRLQGNFPPAAQGPVEGDQVVRQIALNGGILVLLGNEQRLDGKDAIEIDLAGAVLGLRDADGFLPCWTLCCKCLTCSWVRRNATIAFSASSFARRTVCW